ncbi:hypothetical protein HG537_0D00600 [Torulaspora globosa]|uniref:XPG-I domain-containing protein n=1 Tax=Torulaspora globosa TaxID=48254 RepID=A0A7H9HRS0_9SACH|nr:hypothetical protein HG537_0D00600 [Torulaspora sp. CBS 2947]
MGVPQIWELLQPYIKDKRIPFRKLAGEFKKENGRSIRIAIDGYTWLFECGFITSSDSPQRYHGDGKINKAIVNLLHRLKELLSLDVSFIMVFDGNMKPWFKKNFRDECTSISKVLDEDFLIEWKRHERSHSERNYCLGQQPLDDMPEFMVVIKRTLEMMNISYIEACGEGEAQCAWLQKHGYVDYVLSNDSDTLIFGCDKMLRNYSKFMNDTGVTATGSNRPNVLRDAKEPFVTVVELDAIRRSAVERYEWWSLLFFSVLLGADYNQGVKGLGKTKAAKLAQLKDPDFSMEFRSIFEPLDCSSSSRSSRYYRFQKQLLDYCSQNSVKLFGRNYKALLGGEKMEGWPSETAVMCYFHPYLIPNLDVGVFKDKFVNMSENASYRRIDLEEVRTFLQQINPVGVTYFDRWFWGLMQESFILRYVLGIQDGTKDLLEISEEKAFFTHDEKFTYSCWKLRYNNFLHSFDDLHSRTAAQPARRSPSPPKSTSAKFQHSIWIPKQLLPETHILIKRYKEGIKTRRKTSPRKAPKYSPQKNTLDGFLSSHSSPVKDIDSITSVNIPVLQPLKRRLFVETDPEEDTDSDRETNDSSLIILGESRIDDNDGTRIFSLDDELTQDPDDESPLKKQHLQTKKDSRKP